MIKLNTLGNKIKMKIKKYAEKIAKNLKSSHENFVTDMIYGISASQSCVLTEISRELKEKITIKKTEERLSRNLKNFGENETKVVKKNFVEYVKSVTEKESMIIIDPSDVTKPYSYKLESLGIVKDGSTGEMEKGYWTLGAVVLSPNKQQPIPVYEEIYPCKKQGGEGLSVEMEKCLQFFRDNKFSKNSPRVLDRGFDDGKIFENFHVNFEKFIIRQNHNRTVIYKGKKVKISDVIDNTPCNLEMEYTGKNGVTETCKIGMTKVIITKFTKSEMKNFEVNLVVCKGWGDEPLCVYTNIDKPIKDIAVKVIKAYLMRWRIEELYRFKKEKLGFEGFRVRSLQAIKTLDLLVTIVLAFIGISADKVGENEYTISIIAASKPVVKISKFIKETKFFFYAISDGICCALSTLKSALSGYTDFPELNSSQLVLNVI
jgi:hypothetical protein